MANGGVKGGMVLGATDAFSSNALENLVSVPGLHSAILHKLGINHEQLTYRHLGRDFRLTDVSGTVARSVFA